jgi:hypothetical protein
MHICAVHFTAPACRGRLALSWSPRSRAGDPVNPGKEAAMQHPDNPAAAANDRRPGSQATYGGKSGDHTIQ